MQRDRWSCQTFDLPEGAWTEIKVPSCMKFGCNQLIVTVAADCLIGDPSTGWITLRGTFDGGAVWQQIIGGLTWQQTVDGFSAPREIPGRFIAGEAVLALKPVGNFPTTACVEFTR